MKSIAVRGEAAAEIEPRLTARNDVQYSCRDDRAGNLSDNVRRQLGGREALAYSQSHRYGRIQMASGDMTDCVCHRQYGQAEGQRNSGEADTEVRECGG